MHYRFDKRTKATFKKDIKRCSQIEAEIAVRICIDIFYKTNKWPVLQPFGVNFTGDFIPDKVNHSQDYLINNKKIEITHSSKILSRFHEKVEKVKKNINEDGIMVYVNGIDVEIVPSYLCLNSQDLDKFTKISIDKYGGEVLHPGTFKKAYRYETVWFKGMWQMLPILDKEIIPKNYISILDMTT